MDDQKHNLEQQISNLFATYTSQRISRDVVERVKQIIKQQLQEVIAQTIKRSILRDSFNNQLEERDLLSVVERLGPKYKTAIGYHLIKKELTNVKGMEMGGDEGNDGGDD